MDNRGFTLTELLCCMLLLAVIFGIGLYSARGTLATTMGTLNDVSENEIINAAKAYVLEYPVSWHNNNWEYACVPVLELVDSGYFSSDEVKEYSNSKVKLVRDGNTKVIEGIEIVDICE